MPLTPQEIKKIKAEIDRLDGYTECLRELLRAESIEEEKPITTPAMELVGKKYAFMTLIQKFCVEYFIENETATAKSIAAAWFNVKNEKQVSEQQQSAAHSAITVLIRLGLVKTVGKYKDYTYQLVNTIEQTIKMPIIRKVSVMAMNN